MPQRPKPVELHVLNGNPSKKRLPTVPKSEPLTADAIPDGLDREGRAEWRRIVKEWPTIFKRTDRATLFLYCAIWAKCAAAVREGDVPTARDMDAFLRLVTKLGLSPVDRSRLDVGKEDAPKDGIASLLAQKQNRRS